AEAGNTLMGEFDATSETLSGKMEAARAAIARLESRQGVQDRAHEKEILGQQKLAIAVALVFAALACVLGGAAIVLTRTRLLRPLGIIGDYMGRLAEG
ncbi:hypothetical protein OVO43_11935, partial [Streptococcus pneumoniae]|nr:hypothetical protein [Streptococcus pneumoniae]